MEVGGEYRDLNPVDSEICEIKIIRPLEIGYERLPEGITALDFIKYTPVPATKPFKYKLGEVPRHPLFGSAAVPSRDVLETSLKPHSEFYKAVFKEKYGKGWPKTVEVEEEEEMIPWHLVGEPEGASTYDRYTEEDRNILEGLDRETVYEKMKSGEPLPLIRGLGKLMETVDWMEAPPASAESDVSENNGSSN